MLESKICKCKNLFKMTLFKYFLTISNTKHSWSKQIKQVKHAGFKFANVKIQVQDKTNYVLAKT